MIESGKFTIGGISNMMTFVLHERKDFEFFLEEDEFKD